MLDKSTLRSILEDWNYWQSPPPNTIPRRVLTGSIKLQPDLVFVVQGVRRCGKSTLLAQMMKSLDLDPADCTFVNLEDPRFSGDLNDKLLDQIVAFTEERRPQAPRRVFFLDEIQNVQNWEKWLHSKTERPKNNCFVITGSNASLLSGELSSALTGRHTTLELFPFDFEEFLLARPSGSFEDYLSQGGFPRALTYESPEALLREYFTDIIERDVRRHVSVRSTLSLIQLVKAVFESTGSEVSQRSLAGLLGVTADTVGSYLDACESVYILLRCSYFTFSERQRTARNRKYYPIDLGLRNATVAKTGLDKGKKLEAAVFLHLRKRRGEVCYWRNNGEVDLITVDESGITPYQVSWEGIKPRHEAALKEFYTSFPQAKPAVFVTRGNVETFLKDEL